MTILANRCGAVNLGQGFPHFDGLEEIRGKAAEAIMRGPSPCDFLYGQDLFHDRLEGGLRNSLPRNFPRKEAYYVLVDIGSLGFDDDLACFRMLPKQGRGAAIPCSYFWKNRRQGRELVSFYFCKKDEILEETVRQLQIP